MLFLGLIFITGCSSNYIDQNDTNLSKVEEARNEVIDRFTNSRNVIGSGKFIEDTYNLYPNDEVISTIYYYDTALEDMDFYKSSDESEWLDKAKASASKISLSYDEVFSDEIISFVVELLGDEKEQIREETITAEEKCNALTKTEKQGIVDYIQGRYDYYDSQTGKYSGDKYTDTIWQGAEQKYGLSSSCLDEIWTFAYEN